MLFDESLHLARVKQMLAAKYRRLAFISNSKPRREVLARKATFYQRQAVKLLSRIKLGTFANKIDHVLVPRIRKSVIPIVREYWHAMEPGGTGNLFVIGGVRFLITAAHVIDGAVDNGIAMYVPKYQTGELFQITGTRVRNKPLDIAALRFANDVAVRLNGYTFLTPDDTDCRRIVPPPGLYYSYGFPKLGAFASIAEAKIRMSGFPIQARPLERCARFLRRSPEYLWLHAYLNDCDLNGISGSAIWRSIADGESPASWKSDDAKIVAIETGTYERHTIIEGTRIRHAFRMITQEWPEFAPALQPYLAL
ncbi:MAG: trypsin-like peptidase domain-containing protein [Planctomycetales bacterium]|nr:trypsin-like peptidase domain-containing protein [Planctomycetales bacterium]MBN8625558.1 trypsin-like peptidase domain-containing protein [Planctomycetota bacterium]